MKIVVCIKHVPDVQSERRLEGGWLVRGEDDILNELDKNAYMFGNINHQSATNLNIPLYRLNKVVVHNLKYDVLDALSLL